MAPATPVVASRSDAASPSRRIARALLDRPPLDQTISRVLTFGGSVRLRQTGDLHRAWVGISPQGLPLLDPTDNSFDWDDTEEIALWNAGLSALAGLHLADVMTPILGWMAAAPLRSTMEMFPSLAVMGGSGWGKSTIVKNLMLAYGYGNDPVMLQASTPYAIFAKASSTNGLPIWFDEYRAGVRQDAKDAVNQTLRDAWEGGASIRGGTSENLSRVLAVRVTAPIIVSGEDTFSETSHVERIVIVDMPKEGRNESALGVVESVWRDGICLGLPVLWGLQHFFSLYLEWLLVLRLNDELPAPPNIHNRQAHGRAVCEWGYGLLRSFVAAAGLSDVLPAWDESRILAGVADHEDLIGELIVEALGSTDPGDSLLIVWDTPAGDGVPAYRNVRVGAFVQWVSRNRTETLPGGRKAITKYLKENFGAVDHDHRTQYRRCVRWVIEDSAQANPNGL